MNKCSCGLCEYKGNPYNYSLVQTLDAWFEIHGAAYPKYCRKCGDKLLPDGTVESSEYQVKQYIRTQPNSFENIVCPYCKHGTDCFDVKDVWSNNEYVSIDCNSCGREFNVTCHCMFVFDTGKQEAENG